MVEVGGFVAPEFRAVRDVFRENFASRGDVGSAFCVYVEGEEVVNVWGGRADDASGKAWASDTLSVVFSATKGITSICVLSLAQDGMLDIDAPVATYWPEFGARGKDTITLRHVLSHQAGLPCLDDELTKSALLDGRTPVGALAEQEPMWTPGTACGYHAFTYGWILGEVVRRVCGKRIGRFLAEDVTARLGLDTWIGLPDSEHARVAMLTKAESAPNPQLRALLTPGSLMMRSLLVGTDVVAGPQFATPEFLVAELAAANGVSTARSLARLYASVVGAVDGVRLVGDALVREASTVQCEGVDKVVGVPMKYTCGFTPAGRDGAFGFGGTGGSMGLAHPRLRLAAAYVTNRMQQHTGEDPRRAALLDAVFSALGI